MITDSLRKALKKLERKLHQPIKPSGGLGQILNALDPFSNNESSTHKEVKRNNLIHQEHNNLQWVDIKNPNRKELTEHLAAYQFHPLHLDACILRGQLDRVETEEKYLFILIHPPYFKKESGRIVASKVCLFIGKNYVITIHESSPALSELFDLCANDEYERELLFKKSSSFLGYSILKALFKNTASYRKEVLEELDAIDDLVFDIRVSGAHKISQLRQKIVKLKRITGSFKRILQELAIDKSPQTLDMTRYYKNLTNEANNLWDTLEEATDTIEIYKDADITVSTEKTNQILTLLTLVFTLTIPTTILGTFYGMNILLPGGIESGSWFFLGPYTTFYIIGGISIVTITAMLWYFKSKNWF